MKLIIALISLIFISCSLAKADSFVYDSHDKKDPFSYPVLDTAGNNDMETLPGVKLEGITWDEKSPLAIINGKVVGIGDIVSGAEIKEIKENEVIFDANGKDITIKLWRKDEGET